MARLLVLSLGLCFVVLYPVASGSVSVDLRPARQMMRKAMALVPREPLSVFKRRPVPVPAPETPLSAGAVPQSRPSATQTSRPRSSGRSRDFKLPAGTVISVQLRTPVASGTSRVDEQVSAALCDSITRDGVELIPPGSVMFGVVAEVTPAAPRNPLGRIVLAFHVIEHAETGHRAMIASRLVAFEAAVPEPPDDAPKKRRSKKDPLDVELPAGQRFTVTLAEPLLIRIPG